MRSSLGAARVGAVLVLAMAARAAAAAALLEAARQAQARDLVPPEPQGGDAEPKPCPAVRGENAKTLVPARVDRESFPLNWRDPSGLGPGNWADLQAHYDAGLNYYGGYHASNHCWQDTGRSAQGAIDSDETVPFQTQDYINAGYNHVDYTRGMKLEVGDIVEFGPGGGNHIATVVDKQGGDVIVYGQDDTIGAFSGTLTQYSSVPNYTPTGVFHPSSRSLISNNQNLLEYQYMATLKNQDSGNSLIVGGIKYPGDDRIDKSYNDVRSMTVAQLKQALGK